MNLNLQDLIAILGPIGTLIGFMWYHFNNRFEKIDQRFEKIDQRFEKIDEKFEKIDKKIDNLRLELKGEIVRVEEKLVEKMDAVRDRVSRIEGQLVPTKIIAFEESRETRPIEMKEQKSVRRQ